ncbi:Adiponectin receptor protein [Lachnellula suecica]|uniref:Adiponectin receptor protein n=1 Tax=Lachnellula suecica TaxID=602035 RepID=A0A8T9CES9_9HELO|nr:Adiponectin receptor protein [Lachnellula suecica]
MLDDSGDTTAPLLLNRASKLPPIVRASLLLHERLPLWLQEDNHFIETGYRPESNSLQKCLESLLYIHNETVNIYSHLIGSLVFAILPVYFLRTEIPPRYKVATIADLVVCSIYFTGVAVCFFLSATYHTLMSHSHSMCKTGVKLDFQGVILLMWGASVPLIYYGFYCYSTLQNIYWILLSTFAIACSVFTFQPRFSEPFLRPLRAATFGCFAISSMVPVVHGMVTYGYALQGQRIGLKYVLVTLVLNITGATAYAIKFPERWFHRTFDIWGASHQLLHIFVVLAGLTYTAAILQCFDYLHSHPNQCAA